MEKPEIENAIRTFLETKEEILFAYLHGSFVDGDFYRDVDVGLFMDEKKVSDFFNYELNLYSEMWSHFKFEVDAHIINKAPMGFVFHVLRGKLLFTRNEVFLSDYIEKVGLEFAEFEHHRKEYLKHLLYE